MPIALVLTLEVFLAGLGSFMAGKIMLRFLLNRPLLNCRLNETTELIIRQMYLTFVSVQPCFVMCAWLDIFTNCLDPLPVHPGVEIARD